MVRLGLVLLLRPFSRNVCLLESKTARGICRRPVNNLLQLYGIPTQMHTFSAQLNLTRTNTLKVINMNKPNNSCLRSCYNMHYTGQNYNGGSTTLRVKGFHTTPKRYVSPLLWMVVKPVAKIAALFGGRRFRLWWKSLPENQRSKVKILWLNSWQKYLLATSLVAIYLIHYYFSHMQETPITKRTRFIAFTNDQFMKIANFEEKLQKSISKDHFLPATHPSYAQVIDIVKRLVNRNRDVFQMNDQKWTVAIISSTEQNAFVLPTGHVYVDEGLLNFVANDDQLAIVLAHEMAHVVLGHAAEKVSYAQVIDFGVIIVMAAIWAFMPFDGIALITQAFYEKVVQILLDLPYSRKLETEADIVGLQLAAKACYDVREGSNFWKLMELVDKLNGVNSPQWLSTHPVHVKRSLLIDHLTPKAMETREQCGCAPLCPNDPRNKYKEMEKAIQNILIAKKAGQETKHVISLNV